MNNITDVEISQSAKRYIERLLKSKNKLSENTNGMEYKFNENELISSYCNGAFYAREQMKKSDIAQSDDSWFSNITYHPERE
jgi:hypothetical protein